MKRIKQLHSLSQEHHLSLVLANKSIKTAKANDQVAVLALCKSIAEGFDEQWDTHFIKEEKTIFSVIQNRYLTKISQEQTELVTTLLDQHSQMREMAKTIVEGDVEKLEAFGVLLRDHTRLEERQLFPLLENLFTEKELSEIEQCG